MIHEVRQINKLQAGEWLVSYLTLTACKCFYERKSVKVYTKKQPTLKQIENAVNNQRES